MLAIVELKLSPPALAGFLKSHVEPILEKRAAQRFASEGDAASGKWAALSPVTEHFRQTSGFPPSHPINRRTGELEDYITGAGGDAMPLGLGAELVWPKPPAGLVARKIKRAQVGDKRTPARPVMAVDEEDMVATQTALALWIVNG